MIYNFLENNFIALVITIFLILFILTNNNFEKHTNKLFLLAAVCILLLIVEETCEVQLAQLDEPVKLRIVLSAFGYSLRPVIPYLLVIMNNYTKKQMILVTVPLIANALIAFSALFSKLSFSYSSDNHFVRGPLGTAPFLVAGFYVILLLIKTAYDWRKGGSKEALIISAIVLLSFISTVLESIFGFRFLQNPSMATSITFYYMFLHSAQNNRDPLTKALTSRRFFLDSDKYRSSLTAVISLDINDLKQLNDEYGHVEGDKALITVTNVIQKHMSVNTSLYRTGGDEFIILCFKVAEQSVIKIIDKIRADLEKTNYRCAIGYAVYSSDKLFDSVCQLADSRMYENKREMKAKVKA